MTQYSEGYAHFVEEIDVGACELGQVALGNGNVGPARLWLQVPLAHVRQQVAQPILHISISFNKGIREADESRCEEETRGKNLHGYGSQRVERLPWLPGTRISEGRQPH
jgi:hypothetical protein